jgi:carbon-monoxide dehydrogenase medium subunit
MFPNQFDYYRPESVEEALSLLGEHGQRAKLLAGGHSLLPTMKSGLASPDVVVDIGSIDALHGIDVSDDATTFGALTTYADIADSDAAREHCSAVAEAAAAVGDVQVRNRGTIGGNLAHADPASDPPAAVVAADATLVAQGPDGRREIDADDFFDSIYTTALAEDELLTHVEVPKRPDAVGVYAKLPSPSSGYATVGVAAVVRLDGGTVTSASVAATGAFDHCVRLTAVEEELDGASMDATTIEDAAAAATDDAADHVMMDDSQASADYRVQLLTAYVRRALETAADRAGVPAAID